MDTDRTAQTGVFGYLLRLFEEIDLRGLGLMIPAFLVTTGKTNLALLLYTNHFGWTLPIVHTQTYMYSHISYGIERVVDCSSANSASHKLALCFHSLIDRSITARTTLEPQDPKRPKTRPQRLPIPQAYLC